MAIKISMSGFSRLKGFFRSGINYNSYEQIISNAQRKIVGNLPDDLLNLILRKNPTNKKKAILGIQNVFDDAGRALGEINKLETQAIMRTEISERSLKRILAQKNNGGRMFWQTDPLYVEKELESIIKAEEALLKGLKEYLPETRNVVIKPLGLGQFGNTYRLEILGQNGEKLIADKVIKSFRDEPVISKLFKKIHSFINSESDDELLKLVQESSKKLSLTLSETPKTLDDIVKYREQIENLFSQQKQAMLAINREHGAAAEANISEYLRYFSGHKISAKDGIEIPAMFSLGPNPYSISNFVSKNSRATREFSFDRLGLTHGDLHDGNGINGICIDIGGITPKSDTIVGNKSATRFLKRIKGSSPEERKSLLDSMKSEAQTAKSKACIEQIEALL